MLSLMRSSRKCTSEPCMTVSWHCLLLCIDVVVLPYKATFLGLLYNCTFHNRLIFLTLFLTVTQTFCCTSMYLLIFSLTLTTVYSDKCICLFDITVTYDVLLLCIQERVVNSSPSSTVRSWVLISFLSTCVQ